MTHCERLLRVLSDGKPHSHLELYRLGMIVHSRIADLRAQGNKIIAWSERKNGRTLHFYQLSLSGNSAIPLTAAATESVADEPSPPSAAEFPESEQLPLDLPGSVYRPEAA